MKNTSVAIPKPVNGCTLFCLFQTLNFLTVHEPTACFCVYSCRHSNQEVKPGLNTSAKRITHVITSHFLVKVSGWRHTFSASGIKHTAKKCSTLFPEYKWEHGIDNRHTRKIPLLNACRKDFMLLHCGRALPFNMLPSADVVHFL